MSQVNPEILTKFNDHQTQIWQTVSLTVTEASAAPITFGSPLVVSTRTSELYGDLGSAMLVIQFAFASQPEVAQVVLIPGDSFLAFANRVRSETVEEVDENLLADIRPQLEAIVQGICMAVGTIRNAPVVASGLSIRYQVFQFPPNLQQQEELIRSQVAITGDELHASMMWLMDPDTAGLIVGIAAKTDDDQSEDSPFSNLSVQEGGAAGQLSPPGAYEDSSALNLLLDIPLEITVELGRLRMLIKDVIELGTGSIVEIDKAAGEPVDVMVNGRLVAKGEVVVIEDNFGVRITEILTPQERLLKLSEVA